MIGSARWDTFRRLGLNTLRSVYYHATLTACLPDATAWLSAKRYTICPLSVKCLSNKSNEVNFILKEALKLPSLYMHILYMPFKWLEFTRSLPEKRSRDALLLCKVSQWCLWSVLTQHLFCVVFFGKRTEFYSMFFVQKWHSERDFLMSFLCLSCLELCFLGITFLPTCSEL
jgi:hypothetical protein